LLGLRSLKGFRVGRFVRPFPRLTIAQHLVLFSLVVLLPQVTLGSIVASRYAADQRAIVERDARVLAHEHRADLDRDLQVIIVALQTLAGSPDVVDENVAAVRPRMEDLLTRYGMAIELWDANGHRLLGVSAHNVGDFAENPDVGALGRDVVRTRAPLVSGLLSDPATGRPYLLVMVPVIRDGAVTHVLDLALEPANVLYLVLRDIPDGWLASVVDANMRVITRSRDPDRYIGQRGTPQFQEGVRTSNGSFLGGRSLEGDPVFTAFERSKLSGWTVSFAVPLPILDRPLTDLTRTLLAMGVLAAFTSMLMALIYARLLSRSLRRLARSAASVGRQGFRPPGPTAVAEIHEVGTILLEANAELKRWGQRQTTLLAELDHRVKNTLAIIQSLVSQTFRSSRNPDRFQSAITGRVMALARSHEVLSTANWESPELRQLAEAVLLRESNRVHIEGPRVQLRPKAVVALAQSFHELLANAQTHGRLRDAGGVIHLRWRVDLERNLLLLDWLETSPTLRPAPELEVGLGLKIVRICIERQLGGHCSFELRPDHFAFSAQIPLESELGRNATPMS
jgi:two-component sensor histidine kinase